MEPDLLTAPHHADACLRLRVPYEVAPAGVSPVAQGMRAEGPAVPVRHVGSVDVFLEACLDAPEGAVMVIDNGARTDEACIGDLTALELRDAGFAGMVVWGLHRDTADLRRIGFPVFSCGALPTGPRRLDDRPVDALERAKLGSIDVTRGTYVVADDDGVVCFPANRLDDVRAAAGDIARTERAQAEAVGRGENLRTQLDVAGFVVKRQADPVYTFRQHLRERGGAIEE